MKTTSSRHSRREFLASVSAVAATNLAGPVSAAPPRTFGIAYTSFPIRIRQASQAASGTNTALSAEKMIELCHAFGANGCQMDLARLTSNEADYLKRMRSLLETKGMFLELAVSVRTLGDSEALSTAAATARQLGVSRLRTAMLSGRRYEDFSEMQKWKEFVSRSEQIIRQAEPLLRKHQLMLGIENHKDWLIDELVEMLRRASSPFVGACVDFGNNVALLEDPVELARKLAPYAVTTHLKDMAVKRYDQGFELSEVPLGEGIVPLGKIIDILRQSRSDIHLCLEMITRDPLKVPYRDDRYWATFEKRDQDRIQRFEASTLSRESSRPLPRISGLDAAQMLEAEDENIRRSATYAKKTLGL
jgi:3-oxoisoapionate decarboxylase